MSQSVKKAEDSIIRTSHGTAQLGLQQNFDSQSLGASPESKKV